MNEFRPILNPNYKSNFNDFRYLNEDQEESDDEDKNEYSRDNIYDKYKQNELIIKQEIEDEEDDD
jgi:hypothetical protein